jgi:hypothetical protein
MIVLGRLEAWLVKHSGWVALGIITSAFAMRLGYAACCYLNPDEATHFLEAAPSSWLGAYEASRHNPHPPLSVLVLHGMLFLGRTELTLRLPSLLSGTAALWVIFAWIRRSLGKIPALAGLLFMAVSHGSISASTEVREYGLLLLFVSAFLYATQRAAAERSISWAIVQGLFLIAALLTHYVATIAIASLAIYVLVCWLVDEIPRRFIFVMGATYIVLAILLGCLYFGQIRGRINHGSSVEYLRQYYYQRATETVLRFAWGSLSGTFGYAVGAHRSGIVVMLIFLAGLAALAAGRTKARRAMALLVIAPLAIGFAAAVVQVFPFGGSRHQTYLLPFLAIGVAAALAWLHSEAAVTMLLLAVMFAPLWIITRIVLDNDCRYQSMGDMAAAMEYIDQTVPSGALLFVDVETHEVLSYYLARNAHRTERSQLQPDFKERVGNYDVVIPRELTWAFRPHEAVEQVYNSARVLRVPPSEPLWIVSVAWLDSSLASRLPPDQNRDVRIFGRISLIKIPACVPGQIACLGPRRED